MGDKTLNNESARVQVQRSTTRDKQTEVARPKKGTCPFPSGQSFARDTFPPSSRSSTQFGLTETSDEFVDPQG